MPRRGRGSKYRKSSSIHLTTGVKTAAIITLTSTVATLGDQFKKLGSVTQEAAKSLNEFGKTHALVAQPVERLSEKQEGGGSIPSWSTTLVTETVHEGSTRRSTTKLVGRDGRVKAKAEGTVFCPKQERLLVKSDRADTASRPTRYISTRVERVEASEEEAARKRIEEFVYSQARAKERNHKVRRGRTMAEWERQIRNEYGLKA